MQGAVGGVPSRNGTGNREALAIWKIEEVFCPSGIVPLGPEINPR